MMAGRSHPAMDPSSADQDPSPRCTTGTSRSHLTQSILNLSLEIICLLTGEKCAVVTMASVESLLRGMFSPMSEGWSWIPMGPPSYTPIPERNNEPKILEVTNKIIELLTGQGPIGCQDVTVSLSVEEWKILEGHKELSKAAMMEDRPPHTSPDEGEMKERSERSPVWTSDLHLEENIAEACPAALTDLHGCALLDDPPNLEESVRVKSEMAKLDCRLEQLSVDRSLPSHPEDSALVKSEVSTMDISSGPPSLVRLDPPNPEEYLHVKAETVGPDCRLKPRSMVGSSVSSYPEECTLGKSEIPTRDINLGLHSLAVLEKSSNPEKSGSIKTEIPTRDINLGLHSLARPHDPFNPNECLPVKSEIHNPHDHLGLHSVVGLPDPFNFEESTPEDLEIVILDIDSEFANEDSPENLHMPRSVTRDVQPGLQSWDKSRSSSNTKKSPPNKLGTASLDTKPRLHRYFPKYNAVESSPDKTAAALLELQAGLHGVDRSPNSSSPEERTPDRYHTVSANIHSGLLYADRSSNPEGSQISRSHVVMPNPHSGHPYVVRSSHSDCLEEFTPDKLAHFISNLKPGIADFFPDPARSGEPSPKNPARSVGQSSKNPQRLMKPNPKNPSRFAETLSKNPPKSVEPSSENPHRSAEPSSKPPPRFGEPPPKRTKSVKHRIVYPSNNIYPCFECKQQFVLKSDLIVHQKVHAGISGFTCPVCSKPFKGRAELSRHVRSHTGEKPFACSVCGKCFTRRPNLLVHERIHRGEKPFACSQCGRRFTHKQSYERHLILHTGGVTFDCPDCGKDCINKAGFLAHQRLHTRGDPNCNQLLLSRALLEQQQGAHRDKNSSSGLNCAMTVPCKSFR